MPLSYFAFIDESTDPNYNPSAAMRVDWDHVRGEKMHVVTDIGDYDIIGLGPIVYGTEAEARSQIVTIIKEMKI